MGSPDFGKLPYKGCPEFARFWSPSEVGIQAPNKATLQNASQVQNLISQQRQLVPAITAVYYSSFHFIFHYPILIIIATINYSGPLGFGQELEVWAPNS